ncbi:MAG: fatty acid desaturase [Pseudobdellovibrio sp.]|nr:fatty acid desaturase [Pseudobdellovibrio sp.]
MNKATYRSLRQGLNFNFQPLQLGKQISIDLFLFSLITGLFQTSVAPLNIFIIPLFMFRQFSILHEAVHGLSHTNGKINHFCGLIAGTFCLTPFTVWKMAHLKHHYWTGNLEQDPTFAILKTFDQSSSYKKRLIESTWRMGFPLLAGLQHLGFWIFGLQNIKSIEIALSLALPVIFYGALASQLTWGNLAICATGTLIYFRIYEDMIVPQHVGLYSDDEPDHHPPAWDQIPITRSWYLHPFIERHVALNMNYHTEHHLFPDLPWHQLDKAHKLLQTEKELNIVSFFEWMKMQRQRTFAETITPVPGRKKTAA